MSMPESNDPLDALLREQNTYVEDAGFTRRVVQSLPPRSRHRWVRPTVLLAATGIGSVLAWFWLPWKSLLPLNMSTLAANNFQAVFSWAILLSVMAALICGVVAAWQREE